MVDVANSNDYPRNPMIHGFHGVSTLANRHRHNSPVAVNDILIYPVS